MIRTLLAIGEPWTDVEIVRSQALGVDVRFADADRALEELASRPTDAVLARLGQLPTAISLLARVRHAFPDVITILLTVEEPDLQIVSDALIGAGVNGLLREPIDPEAIAREIEKAAERLRPQSSAPPTGEVVDKRVQRLQRALDRERTLRAELEHLLEDKTRELYLAAELQREQQAALVASEKMNALGRLAAGVAHEINNALNVVHGNLPHLEHYIVGYRAVLAAYRDGASPEVIAETEREVRMSFIEKDMPKLLSAMTIGVERATQIVHDMAVFSRRDESEGFTKVSVDAALQIALTLAAPRIGRGITVHVDEEVTPAIEGHAGRLSQVLLNLLINASDAIGEKGEIHVTRSCTGERVMISVRDTGSGVAPELADRLFEPFFTTKPVGAGTGLGLFVSRQIVEEHGGTIQFVSSPAGTTFVVSLPILRAT